MKDRVALVVFSGGQDSTTCLHWALSQFKSVEAIFFNYGQRHVLEIEAAKTIAANQSVPLKIFTLDFFTQMGGNALVDPAMAIGPVGDEDTLPNTFVPGRNLIFLTYAASYAFTRGIRDLVTGVCQTDYSGYPDCRDDTLRSLERALGQGLGWIDSGTHPAKEAGFIIHTPLMFRTKADSVLWAVELGAMDSLAYSHTCYEGLFPPCGKCPACMLRKKGFQEAGILDPLETRAAQIR